MHVNHFTKQLSEEEKHVFETYLNEKLPKFIKFFEEFDEDTVKLDAKAEKFVKNNAFKVELVMEIPKVGILRADEDSRDLRGAVDSAEHKLVEQIKRHMEKLHHEHQRAT